MALLPISQSEGNFSDYYGILRIHRNTFFPFDFLTRVLSLPMYGKLSTTNLLSVWQACFNLLPISQSEDCDRYIKILLCCPTGQSHSADTNSSFHQQKYNSKALFKILFHSLYKFTKLLCIVV